MGTFYIASELKQHRFPKMALIPPLDFTPTRSPPARPQLSNWHDPLTLTKTSNLPLIACFTFHPPAGSVSFPFKMYPEPDFSLFCHSHSIRKPTISAWTPAKVSSKANWIFSVKRECLKPPCAHHPVQQFQRFLLLSPWRPLIFPLWHQIFSCMNSLS